MRALLILCLSLFAFTSHGQLYLKAKSKTYLNKTARIIKITHKDLAQVREKEQRGLFAKSVKHQRQAKAFFEKGDFKNALYHSNYARDLVFNVYMYNNPDFPQNFEYSANERALMAGRPSDETLQATLVRLNPGITFEDEPYEQDEKLYDLEVN